MALLYDTAPYRQSPLPEGWDELPDYLGLPDEDSEEQDKTWWGRFQGGVPPALTEYRAQVRNVARREVHERVPKASLWPSERQHAPSVPANRTGRNPAPVLTFEELLGMIPSGISVTLYLQAANESCVPRVVSDAFLSGHWRFWYIVPAEEGGDWLPKAGEPWPPLLEEGRDEYDRVVRYCRSVAWRYDDTMRARRARRDL